ncbi:hypothetical protein TNCV_1403561 [Trichonephila clavipes]|nr:hypothetical protein TNCV_1403561 [Trichonephila clavipes]
MPDRIKPEELASHSIRCSGSALRKLSISLAVHQLAIPNDIQASMSAYADSSPYHQITPSEIGSFLNKYRVTSSATFSPCQKNTPGVPISTE